MTDNTLAQIEIQGDEWTITRIMGQNLGFWGWETTLRQIEEQLARGEKNIQQGIDHVIRKIATNVTNKKEKATTTITQWIKWHNIQKSTRKLIKQDKAAHYEHQKTKKTRKLENKEIRRQSGK